MSKEEINRNIAERVAKEKNDADEKRAKRKKVAKAKAKAGRIKADKRSKK